MENHTQFKSWLKTNWFKLSILVVISGSFYWFAWRPVQIRKNCSWVHVREAAIPAVPGDDSIVLPEKPIVSSPFLRSPFPSKQAEYDSLLSKKNGSPGRLAEDYWTAASDKEFKECLRAAGQRN